MKAKTRKRWEFSPPQTCVQVCASRRERAKDKKGKKKRETISKRIMEREREERNFLLPLTRACRREGR